MLKNKRKILVVEDDRTLSRAIEVELKKGGFEVELAYNGEEVAGIISKEKFDLILLDLILPRKDGFQVLEELKDAGSKIPVVVSSNLCTKDDKEKALALGAKDFLVKADMRISELVNRARGALNL